MWRIRLRWRRRWRGLGGANACAGFICRTSSGRSYLILKAQEAVLMRTIAAGILPALFCGVLAAQSAGAPLQVGLSCGTIAAPANRGACCGNARSILCDRACRRQPGVRSCDGEAERSRGLLRTHFQPERPALPQHQYQPEVVAAVGVQFAAEADRGRPGVDRRGSI